MSQTGHSAAQEKANLAKKTMGDDGKRETRSCRPCIAEGRSEPFRNGVDWFYTNWLWDQNQNLSCVNGKVIVGLCVWDVSAQLRASLACSCKVSLHACSSPAGRFNLCMGVFKCCSHTHREVYSKKWIHTAFRMVSPCHPCIKNEF
jgi:hypothetical protein